jgi:hypothetical protein
MEPATPSRRLNWPIRPLVAFSMWVRARVDRRKFDVRGVSMRRRSSRRGRWRLVDLRGRWDFGSWVQRRGLGLGSVVDCRWEIVLWIDWVVSLSMIE